jgi:hypothetical protein
MSKSWRWYSLTLVAALCACDDDSGSHDDHKNDGKLLVSAEVCDDETATVYVGDERVYDGNAATLVAMPVDAPSGEAQVTVWISGQKAVEQTVTIAKGETTTVTSDRMPECGGDGDGDGTLDGGLPDGGDDDGDGGPLTACSSEDDVREHAQEIVAGDREDQLCSHSDVDFFKFTVGDMHATTLTLVTTDESGIWGELTVYDAEGNMLDVQQEGEEDAVSTAVLFEGEYYVRVADLSGPGPGDSGVPTRAYTLKLAFASQDATNEVSAGTFHGTTNDPEVPGLTGTFVAVSVHDANKQPVPFVVHVRITLPGAAPEEFSFDPDALPDGVLRTVFFDGTVPVFKSAGAHRSPFAGWQMRPIQRVQPGKFVTKEAVDGEVTVEFATGEVVKRKVEKAKLMPIPAVSAATASGDPSTIAVTSTRPAEASAVFAEAFGAEGGAHGSVTPTAATFDIALDKKLEDEEAFVVRVRAADQGLLTLPLPAETNLSEFVFYSDETAGSQE